MSTVTPIGIIHSELKRREDCPKQEHENAPKAIIDIFPEYKEALKDLSQGDAIILLTWLHLADRTVLSVHPRDNPENTLTGVFSTRSPDRPNPIGVHYVEVVEILSDLQFQVSNLEVLNTTPLLDIKPDYKKK